MREFWNSLFFICILLVSSCDTDDGFINVNENVAYKLDTLHSMPAVIDECSGFINIDGNLFIINDGAGGAYLYDMDPEKNIMNEVIDLNDLISNRDWEAITQTEDEIIIGDVGNNKGKNNSQKLYHINKEDYSLNSTVEFTYPEQTTNTAVHNFDCEAMIIMDGQYCLFTKNRADTNTDLYTAAIGSSVFSFKSSLAVPARVTDAYYDESVGAVLLLCNEKIDGVFINFIKVVSIEDNFSLDQMVTIPLPVTDKLEAIAKKENDSYYLGSETESGGLGLLYKVDIRGL